jgi:hypothetical protein
MGRREAGSGGKGDAQGGTTTEGQSPQGQLSRRIFPSFLYASYLYDRMYILKTHYTCFYIIGLLIQHDSDGSSEIFNGAAMRAWSL